MLANASIKAVNQPDVTSLGTPLQPTNNIINTKTTDWAVHQTATRWDTLGNKNNVQYVDNKWRYQHS